MDEGADSQSVLATYKVGLVIVYNLNIYKPNKPLKILNVIQNCSNNSISNCRHSFGNDKVNVVAGGKVLTITQGANELFSLYK